MSAKPSSLPRSSDPAGTSVSSRRSIIWGLLALSAFCLICAISFTVLAVRTPNTAPNNDTDLSVNSFSGHNRPKGWTTEGRVEGGFDVSDFLAGGARDFLPSEVRTLLNIHQQALAGDNAPILQEVERALLQIADSFYQSGSVEQWALITDAVAVAMYQRDEETRLASYQHFLRIAEDFEAPISLRARAYRLAAQSGASSIPAAIELLEAQQALDAQSYLSDQSPIQTSGEMIAGSSTLALYLGATGRRHDSAVVAIAAADNPRFAQYRDIQSEMLTNAAVSLLAGGDTDTAHQLFDRLFTEFADTLHDPGYKIALERMWIESHPDFQAPIAQANQLLELWHRHSDRVSPEAFELARIAAGRLAAVGRISESLALLRSSEAAALDHLHSSIQPTNNESYSAIWNDIGLLRLRRFTMTLSLYPEDPNIYSEALVIIHEHPDLPGLEQVINWVARQPQ